MFIEPGDSINAPVPPHHSDGGFRVLHYNLDAEGRVVKSTEYNTSDKNDLPPHVITYAYDEHGNLVRQRYNPMYETYTEYDNKINLYRTNKVWMFVYNDYSVNNPVEIFTDKSRENRYLLAITKYNSFGLPLQFKVDMAASFTSYLLGYEFESLEVEYSCKD